MSGLSIERMVSLVAPEMRSGEEEMALSVNATVTFQDSSEDAATLRGPGKLFHTGQEPVT